MTSVNPVSNAGVDAPRAYTCTRSGTDVSLSTAIVTLPTSDAAVLGLQHELVGGPPGDARRVVDRDLRRRGDRGDRLRRRLLRRRQLSHWSLSSADCSGVAPGRSSGWPGWRGTSTARRSVPLWTTSLSARSPTRATRCFSGPSSQTRSVCEPVTRFGQDSSADPAPPVVGSSGSPRRAVSTTVPDSAGGCGGQQVGEQLLGAAGRQVRVVRPRGDPGQDRGGGDGRPGDEGDGPAQPACGRMVDCDGHHICERQCER